MPIRLELPDLPELPDGALIQKLLDEWLADHPDYQQYVSKVYYAPSGEAPIDATHTLELVSLRSSEQVMLAVVVKPPYAGVVDAALAALNRQ